MGSGHYFHRSYGAVRGAFKDAVGARGGRVRHYTHPRPGPGGKALATDVARFGEPKASRVLFLVTGTHGVEAYCGAGCLTAWLHGNSPDNLPADVAVVLVNLINPFGTAWLRRVNENNVDINRNFVDHGKAYRHNPEYEALHDSLLLTDLATEKVAAADRRVADYRREQGDAAYFRAFGGQYSHPQGILFGGHEPTWSNRLIRELWREHAAHASHAALIDFHSGMGPYGYGMPIAPYRPGAAAYERAHAWYGDALVSMYALDKPDADTDSDALVGGAMIEAFAAHLPDAVTTAIALEFGTYPFDDCIPAMRADAWQHGFGQPDSPLGRQIGSDWLEKFFPDDQGWLDMVHWRSRQVIEQALRGFAKDEPASLEPDKPTARSRQAGPRRIGHNGRSTSMAPAFAQCFSSSYAEARDKFRGAAKAAGASLQSFINDHSGPNGEQLATDAAYLGDPGAPKLLVMICGTHGVESLCGSGIQTGWLTEREFDELPDDCAALLIHCINPFGAAWRRRVNEDNVDLNRNFVDHVKPHFENPYYGKLHDLLVPGGAKLPVRLQSDADIAQFRRQRGEGAFQIGILGQYSHPNGINFGGYEPVWSARVIDSLIEEHCTHRRHLATMDLHTGLGLFGHGLVGIANDPDSTGAGHGRAWYGPAMTTFAEAGEHAGYPDYNHFIDGLLMRAFFKRLPKVNVVAAGIEFGTCPIEKVLAAEIADLWLHNNPGADPALAERIRSELLAVYYPATLDWQEMVWWRARQVIRQTLRGLAAL